MSNKKAGQCACGKLAWEHGEVEPSGALAGAGSTPVLDGVDKWKFLALTHETEALSAFRELHKLKRELNDLVKSLEKSWGVVVDETDLRRNSFCEKHLANIDKIKERMELLSK